MKRSATMNTAPSTGSENEVLIGARNVFAGYGSVAVVHDLNITVRRGEVVALLGPNGAGKTTALLTLSGHLRPMSGDVLWRNRPSKSSIHARCGDGLAFVTEDRSIFPSMTTRENLRVGRCDIDYALTLFPELESHLPRQAGLLSGGQQQMLSLARALARRPQVLLADELSLGLAPLVVNRLLQVVRQAADSGVAVLLVEQHVRKALAVADFAHVMRRGRIEFAGTSREATAAIADIEAGYLAADV